MWPNCCWGPKYLLIFALHNLRCCPFLCCAHLAIASPLSPYKFNEKIGGQRLVYGDILLSPRQIKLSRLLKAGGQMAKHIALKARQNNRWPNNEIPFIFSVKFNERQKRAIREALAVLEDSSCFRFIPRTKQRDFLFIDMREGCFSFVGKVGGRQLLSLAAGCLHDYIIWHEVMHALGLEHEHQRPDRDKFIRIHWANVEADKHLNFEKIPRTDVDLYHTYDYHSLMHYDGTAFGKTDPDTGEPMTTMEPLRDGVELTDNFELTNFDVEKLQILSNCNQKRRKLRPGMEPKLITDPGSVERAAECTDRSANCRTLKKNGFCWEMRYVRLIRIQCQHTCGFCESDGGQNGHGNEEKNEQGNGAQSQGMVKEDGQDENQDRVTSLDKMDGQEEQQDYDQKRVGQDWDDNGNGVVKTDDGQEVVGNGNQRQNVDRISLDKHRGGQAEEDYDKSNGDELDYGNGIGEDWHNTNTNNNNNNNHIAGSGRGTTHDQNGHDGIIKTNGQDENNLSGKKKKRKKLLLKAGDEADKGRQRLLSKVDEHYTKWAFPEKRPTDDDDDYDAANDDEAANGGRRTKGTADP